MPSSEKLETILVVDDTPAILTVVVAVLKTANFNVLTGRSGAEAISVAMRYEGTIHLLLSDIQMPGMNGPELGKLLKAQSQTSELMSGMTDGNLLVLNYGWAFIEKPFVAEKLLHMIDVVLHSPDKSQGSDQYDTRK